MGLQFLTLLLFIVLWASNGTLSGEVYKPRFEPASTPILSWQPNKTTIAEQDTPFVPKKDNQKYKLLKENQTFWGSLFKKTKYNLILVGLAFIPYVGIIPYLILFFNNIYLGITLSMELLKAGI